MADLWSVLLGVPCHSSSAHTPPQVGDICQDMLSLPKIERVAAQHLVPLTMGFDTPPTAFVHLWPKKRPDTSFPPPTPGQLHHRGQHHLRETVEHVLGDQPRVRFIAHEMFIRRAALIIVHHKAPSNRPASIASGHRGPLDCGLQPPFHMVLDILSAVLAGHTEALAVELAPEVIDILSTDNPAAMLGDLLEKPVVFGLPPIAEQPIILAAQDDPALATGQQVREPVMQTWSVLNRRTVGAYSHVLIKNLNRVSGKAPSDVRLMYQISRIDFRTEEVTLFLHQCALPHEHGTEGIEWQGLGLRIGVLRQLGAVTGHGR